MSKHTKGPWFFDQYGHVYGTVDGQPIDGLPGGKTILHPHVCTPRCIANARLIAAAPELLEALKLALEYWRHRQQRYKNRSPVWVQAARAAITKATGESA